MGGGWWVGEGGEGQSGWVGEGGRMGKSGRGVSCVSEGSMSSM